VALRQILLRRTSDTLETLSYLPRLIKHIAANIPIIANKNSKPSVEVSKDENLRRDGWEILWYDEDDLNDKERVKEEIRREIDKFQSKNTSLI